jgi:hypothetical protein
MAWSSCWDRLLAPGMLRSIIYLGIIEILSFSKYFYFNKFSYFFSAFISATASAIQISRMVLSLVDFWTSLIAASPTSEWRASSAKSESMRDTVSPFHPSLF